MGSPLDSMTDDEVRQIAALVETLDRSSFDFLQVSVGNLKVTIGRGSAPMAAAGPVPSAAPPPSVPAPASPGEVAPVPVAAPLPAATPSPQPAAGTVAIVAPMMGTFYAQPSPGAQPFVQVGDRITADTTIGLIEVMKLFTPVVAGVDGVVVEVCVQNSQLVEYQQTLFRIRPADVTEADTAGRSVA